MRIQADGRDWGVVETTERADAVEFLVRGARNDAVWRVWGCREGKQPLLIGIPEPDGAEMLLRRTLSKDYLARCGYFPDLPEWYTAGEQFDAVRTLTCRFASDCAFAFAAAFSVCTVCGDTARLRVDARTGEPLPPDSKT